MLVREIRVTNFKAFYGEHVIAFPAPSRRRNVYLLGGQNGAGKTTVVQAVLLALYGVGAAGLPGMFSATRDFRRQYELWLAAARNGRSRDEQQDLVRVSVTFEVEESRVVVNRSYWYDAGGRLAEELLEIREDRGGDTELLSGEVAQERVAAWMPRHLAELIFFDGEQLPSQLRDDTGAVADALDRLLALEPVAKLLEDIKRLSRDRRGAVLSAGQNAAMQSLEEQSAELDQHSRQVGRTARDLSLEEASLVAELSRLQKLLDERLAGSAPLTSGQVDAELRSLRVRRDELRGRLGRQLGDWLYLALASDVLGPTEAAVASERELRRGRERSKIEQQATAAFGDLLLSHLESVLASDAAAVLRATVAELQAESWKSADQAQASHAETSLYALGDEELAWAEETASSLHRRDLQDCTYLARDLLDAQQRIADLEKSSSALGSHGLVDQLVTRLHALTAELSDVRTRLADVQQEQRELNERRGQLGGALRRLTQRADDSADATAWLEAADLLSSALVTYVEERRRLAITQVEQALLARLRDLLHKRQLVKSVAIDTVTYGVQLNGPRGRPVELPSAGEHQLVAMAFAAAILDCSTSPLPMFVDTPLARLDASHRENVATRFWPRVGRQVFVLSTDEEVAGSLLEQIRPFVAETYSVVHDDTSGESHVETGAYFEGVGLG
jgi:DNA sulfur modification protein DndD